MDHRARAERIERLFSPLLPFPVRRSAKRSASWPSATSTGSMRAPGASRARTSPCSARFFGRHRISSLGSGPRVAVLRSRGSSRVAARGTLPPGGRRGRAAGTRRPVRCAEHFRIGFGACERFREGIERLSELVTSSSTCPERIARSCNRVGGLPTRALGGRVGAASARARAHVVGCAGSPDRRGGGAASACAPRPWPSAVQSEGRDLAEGVARAEWADSPPSVWTAARPVR